MDWLLEQIIWLFEQLRACAMTAGLRLVGAALVCVIGFKVSGYLVKKLKKCQKFSDADPSATGFIASCISIGLKIVVIVSVIAILGVPMSSVVALVASAGVAIGLAVQGALSNLVGGIMILFFRPFKVDDYIESAGASGTVRAITVFYTVLTTPDNKVVTVPNGSLTNSVVTNYSTEETRRIDINFVATYEKDSHEVKDIMLKSAASCSKVLKGPEAYAVILDCNERGIEYSLRVWCKNVDYWDVKFELTESIRNAFVDAEIDVPYPKMEVRIEK